MSLTIEGGVLKGADGWLFLVEGSNDVLDLYTNECAFTDDAARAWAEIVSKRIALADELHAKFLHLVAPEKLCVYQNESGVVGKLTRPAKRVEEYLASAGQSSYFLDLCDVLVATSAVVPAYLKTDTHWTWEGVKAVFRTACYRLGLITAGLPDEEDLIRYEGVFDLGGKLSPAVKEANVHREFSSTVQRTRANPVADLWDLSAKNSLPVKIHNSLSVSYGNSAPHALDEVVVLFGDSFLDFRTTNVTGLFAEAFREVHFVWSTSLDYEFVRALRPTVIVTETAERFMRLVPTDDYNVERDMKERLSQLEPPR